MNHTLPLAQLPGTSPFLRSYSAPCAAGDPACAAHWLHYDPHDPQSVGLRLKELETVWNDAAAQRAAVAEVLAEQQAAWQADAAAVENVRALASPDTYCVITGQQPGLFGGPLYTQLKAISVIACARKLEALHPGKRFVPCFWMPTGDSDFDEVRGATLLDPNGMPVRIELPRESSASRRVLRARDDSAAIGAALDELATLLPGGDHRADVLALVKQAYRGQTLVSGFARLMARLFSREGLVLVDPLDPRLMQFARPLLLQEIEHSGETGAALAARNAQLAAAGFVPQVASAPEDTNLFYLDDSGQRDKIVRAEAGFTLRNSGEAFTRAEMSMLAASQPQRFVCGALVGPIYQELLLPVAAFFGGGAELAYRAQSAALYERLGRKSAPAYLRATATLLPRRSIETLAQNALDLTDLFVPEQQMAEHAVAGDRPADLQAALNDYLDAIHGADARLREIATRLDPSLETSFDTLRGNMIRHVERLEKKVSSSLKQRADVKLRRLRLIQQQAFPGQQLQERSLSLLAFAPRFGLSFLDALSEATDVPAWEHRVFPL